MTATPNDPPSATPAAPTPAGPGNAAARATAPPPGPTPLVQVQRDALTSLQHGVAQRAAQLAAADTAHQRRVAWLQRRRENTADTAKRRHKRSAKAAAARADAAQRELQREHQAALAQFDADATKQRTQIADKTRELQQKTTSDFEYDRWIAGSIFEGAATKLKQWLKDRRQEKAQAKTRVAELTGDAQETLERFRMPDQAVRLNLEEAQDDTDPAAASTAAPSAATPDTNDDTAAAAAAAAESNAPYPPAFDPDQPLAWYEDTQQRLKRKTRQIAHAGLPNLFAGIRPWVLATALVFLGGCMGTILPTQYGDTEIPPPVLVMLTATATLFVAIALWWLFFRLARKNTARRVTELLELRAQADESLQTFERWARQHQASQLADARDARDAQLHKAETKHGPVINELRQQRRAQLEALDADLAQQRHALVQQSEERAAQLNKQTAQREHQQTQRAARRTDITTQRYDRDLAKAESALQQARQAAEERWTQQRDTALATLDAINQQAAVDSPDWSSPAWSTWSPPTQPAALSAFGQMRCAAQHLLDRADAQDLGLPASLDLPAVLSMPGPRSWMIEASPDDRACALSAMRSLILRLMTTQPPGRVRLTLLDPVALGESFADLMHLADHDEQLVNSRVWSEPGHMEQRLVDLTDHMALVIQKYLRNDFETIEAYNAQAGELAEPYRFLVMADLPHGLSEDGLARLTSIASAGARCGVFVLLLRDPRKTLTQAVQDDLRRHCVTVSRKGTEQGPDRWRIRGDIFERFPLTLHQAPGDALGTSIIQRIGAGAVDAERVQVPFDSITPDAAQRWTADSAEELSVPIGRTGATRLQRFTLGHGVEQHALIAGKTGSGKSSMLHALVTNLALWYPPDQLEVYLIDFKKGVEFKPYVTHRLPHARAIAIESDRAFGLSILHELDRLMDERGERYREAGVQNLAQFRKAMPDEPMPRVLLVIDEFQEFFSRDDQVAQDAALLLDRLVRQGRAFGVHALLGSQSLSGAAGLARGTLGQMAVRVALQCNEADSQLILNDENTAARLLSRPGEAIYNPRGGDLGDNSVFQIAWLPDEEHLDTLRTIDTLRKDRSIDPLPRAVFEGSAPALLSENTHLRALLDKAPATAPPALPLAFVGDPIAIDAPTALRLPREPGANALIVGGSPDTAIPLFIASAVSLAAQHPVGAARFVLLNGSSEPAHDEQLRRLGESLPHGFDVVSPRDATERLTQTHQEMKRRLDADEHDAPAVYLMVFGLQRFRDFRKQEESFSFSMDDDDAGPPKTPPDKALAELLRDGPALGLHLIAWADRAATVENTFDRRDLREFDCRVLFQMSANDSAQLIDSTDANDLGGFRALLHREDRGTLTRFRPYGPVPHAWLEHVASQLAPTPAP